MARTALSLLLCAMLLTACASSVPVPGPVEVIRPKVPAGLLDCPDAPLPPPSGATQRDVAFWVLDLHSAHADCRTKLGKVRELVEME